MQSAYTAAGLLGNATRPWPGPPRAPGGRSLPLSSSDLPRAGCTGAGAAAGRESSRGAGSAAAAPPASGVKERPWHPSPQGRSSSTLCSRARPAPTRSHPSRRARPGSQWRGPRGACLRRRPALAWLPSGRRKKQTEHPVHPQIGPGKASEGGQEVGVARPPKPPGLGRLARQALGLPLIHCLAGSPNGLLQIWCSL